MLAHLRATHPGISLTGSDLLPETLRVARDRVPDATFLQADIRQMPYREEFDVVCALDVIEHIDEDDVALGEVARAVEARRAASWSRSRSTCGSGARGTS